jgi:hypothetical protein
MAAPAASPLAPLRERNPQETTGPKRTRPGPGWPLDVPFCSCAGGRMGGRPGVGRARRRKGRYFRTCRSSRSGETLTDLLRSAHTRVAGVALPRGHGLHSWGGESPSTIASRPPSRGGFSSPVRWRFHDPDGPPGVLAASRLRGNQQGETSRSRSFPSTGEVRSRDAALRLPRRWPGTRSSPRSGEVTGSSSGLPCGVGPDGLLPGSCGDSVCDWGSRSSLTPASGPLCPRPANRGSAGRARPTSSNLAPLQPHSRRESHTWHFFSRRAATGEASTAPPAMATLPPMPWPILGPNVRK